MFGLRRIAVLLVILGVYAPSLSAFPFKVSYGGRLVNEQGDPVAGPVTLHLDFYNVSSGGSPIVLPTLSDFTNVTLADGIFQILISLPQSEFNSIFSNNQVYVGVTDVTHGVTYPRHQLTTIPYALRVPIDQESIVTDSEGQLVVGELVELTLKASGNNRLMVKAPSTVSGQVTLTLPATTGSTGQFLKSNGTGAMNWETPSGLGNMLKSVYDTNDDGVVNSADNALLLGGNTPGYYLNLDNQSEGTTNKFFTATEKTKLGGIAAGADDVNATTVNDAGALMKSQIPAGPGVVYKDNGGVYTTISLNSSAIADGTITTSDIADGTITSADVSGGLGTMASQNSDGVTISGAALTVRPLGPLYPVQGRLQL